MGIDSPSPNTDTSSVQPPHSIFKNVTEGICKQASWCPWSPHKSDLPLLKQWCSLPSASTLRPLLKVIRPLMDSQHFPLPEAPHPVHSDPRGLPWMQSWLLSWLSHIPVTGMHILTWFNYRGLTQYTEWIRELQEFKREAHSTPA